MTDILDWLKPELEYRCPGCKKPKIGSLSQGGIKIHCWGCDTRTYITNDWDFDTDTLEYNPPNGDWIRGEPQRLKAVCPECGSDRVSHRAIDDGPGYVDRKLDCNNCDHNSWR